MQLRTCWAKPVSFLKANVSQGNAPLEVSFSGSGNDPDGKIVKYELDFEGDDICDLSSTTNVNVNHIYSMSGVYSPILKVTDNDGYFNTAGIIVAVGRSFPAVQLKAIPQKGNAPLSVSFTADSFDRDGFITLYEWDFDDDDIYDSSSNFDSLIYVYDSSGNYKVMVRVTDSDGLSATSLTNVVINPAGSPCAKISASPAVGNIPLDVCFNGKGTDQDGEIVKYEFDFNGDGIYETSYNTLGVNDSVKCVYSTVGIYSAGLKVTDEDGLTDYDFVKIFVSSASLWVADHYNNRVVKLGINGKEQKRLSGFNRPYTVSVNVVDGSCWVADVVSSQIVKLSCVGQELLRVSGFNRPSWVSVNSCDGSCLVADESNHKVVKLDADGHELFRVGGFYYPHAVSVNTSDGSCWIADTRHSQIVKLSSNGVESKRISGFNSPMDVCVDFYDGGCWISNTNSGQIIKLDSTGQELLRIIGFNSSYGRLAVNHVDRSCWIADRNNGRIVRVDRFGKGIVTVSGFSSPEAVSPDTDGGCWVGDTYGGRVVKLSANGTKLYETKGFYLPTSVSFDPGTIKSSLPSVEANITPSNGDISLTVSFSGVGTDASAAITGYEWDFEGDGVYDHFSSTAEGASILHAYSSAGIYNPVLRVTNSNNLVGFDYRNVDFTVSVFSPNGLVTKYEWDFQGDGVYDWSSLTTGNTNYTYSKMGRYQPVVRITDQTGEEFVKCAPEIIVTQSNPVAVLNVSPASGVRPLSVLFKMNASYDLDGSITLYELDYNNDGVYDWTNKVPDEFGYIYNLAKAYSPVLRVTDNDGLFSTTKVLVAVNPVPVTVSASVSHSVGKSPLNVSFSGAAKSDHQITLYEWNFGDGNKDSTAIIDHTYNSTGSYKAIFKAVDSTGAYATASVVITVLPQSTPTAIVDVSPTLGDTPLKVNFNGSGTDEDGQIVKYEWDFDGNGTYDYTRTIPDKTTYTYKIPGAYKVKLKVTDDNNLIGTGEILIQVNAPSAPQVQALANPSQGMKPLMVSLSGLATDMDGTIIGMARMILAILPK